VSDTVDDGVAVGHSPVHVGVGVGVGHSPVQVGVGDTVSVDDTVGVGNVVAVGIRVGVPLCSEVDGKNTTSNTITMIRATAATESQIFLPSFVDLPQIAFLPDMYRVTYPVRRNILCLGVE